METKDLVEGIILHSKKVTVEIVKSSKLVNVPVLGRKVLEMQETFENDLF